MKSYRLHSKMNRTATVRLLRAAGFCGSCVFCVFCGSNEAQAQLADYDKGQLIDALAAENMTELLQRLIETDPPDDPVEAQQIEIAQHRLRYTDATLGVDDRVAALERALAAMRELIAAHADHELRPLWQTDLAAMLLETYLGGVHANADLFCEFGVPTAAQRDAFARAVAEAHALAADANLRFFTLRGELPRRADHVTRRVNTGLWERMIDDYYLKRTQFYLARAAYLASLLPEGETPAPRDRLLAEALNAIDNTAVKLKDDPGVADAVAALLGRIKLRRGDLAGADADLAQAANGDGVTQLVARLARVQLTARRSDAAAALAELKQVESLPLVRDNLTYRLLAADLEHRLQPAGSAASYEPYLRLLGDRALGDRAEGLRRYIYQRWADDAPAGAEETLPPVVRMAMAQTLREQGQLARQANDEARAAALFDRSIRINRALADSDAPPQVKVAAAYNLGLAMYLRAADTDAMIAAADVLTDAAERYPAQPAAEAAIRDAVAIARSLHAQSPRPAGADAAYRRAADVLFARYATTPAADAERVYYAYSVLQPAGDYAAAVEFYRKVPQDSETFHDAQRELLFVLERQALAGEPTPELPALIERVLSRVSSDTSAPVRRAAAAAQLVRAQLAAKEGRIDEALSILDEVERGHADDPDMLRLTLERRILLLAEANRAQPLAAAAEHMMAAFPDDAAAVIDSVLTRIDAQIETLRPVADNPTAAASERDAARQRIDALAQTASALADLLVAWAQRQGFDEGQMVAYELIRVKVLLLAGDAARAVEIADQQRAKFPDDLSVLHYAGEAHYEAGDEPSLIRAAQTFDRIIGGLSPPYPPEYWHAWMRRMQINDRLGKFTEQIGPTVRQLEMQDAQLGGAPYSVELRRLARKYGS